MTLNSIGDLAQGYMLRAQHGMLRSRMNTLVQELASGRTADAGRHLKGSYTYLADIERSLTNLDGYATATSEARLSARVMQGALENFQTIATDLGLAAITGAQSNIPQVVRDTSAAAREDFDRMIAALNTDAAGRRLFSGTATDQPPLAAPDAILGDLRTALVGQTTLGGVQAVVETWFDSGGTFDTVAYLGGTQSAAPIAVAEGDRLALDIRADDPAFRTLLGHAAMAALAADATLGFSRELQSEIMQAAGEGLSFEQAGLTGIRSDLGYAEARIEDAQVRNSAERTALQIAKSELLAVDPYETATELENVQFRLESLYSVTVRLSRLSLVEYLG